MISVLVVEDSQADRDMLVAILAADRGLEVVATAENGEQALALASSLHPDVVVMDWEMAVVDGLAATRRLMEDDPRPVVLVSERWSRDDGAAWALVHDAGAVAAVRKPREPGSPDYAEASRDLLRAVHRSAGVKLVRRWRRVPRGERTPAAPPIRVVAIGVSTGGPPVLEAILARLPADFAAPILIVQHIAEGFVRGLVDWLDRVTPLRVGLAAHGQPAVAGHVYIAPDRRHLGIDAGARLVLDSSPPEQSQRPAVSYLFRSVKQAFGGNAAAVLLTGMGSDGAAELKALRDARALTVAQDEESCAIFGMPAEAIKIGAAQYVLPPREIGDLLVRVCQPTPAVVAAPARSDRKLKLPVQKS